MSTPPSSLLLATEEQRGHSMGRTPRATGHLGSPEVPARLSSSWASVSCPAHPPSRALHQVCVQHMQEDEWGLGASKCLHRQTNTVLDAFTNYRPGARTLILFPVLWPWMAPQIRSRFADFKN